MHELSIVEALIDNVQREVEGSGHRGRVTRVDVAIGRLSGVNADCFRFALEMLAPGTLLEAAEVRISEPGATCRCQACGGSTEVSQLVTQCPMCGSAEVTLEGGSDLWLQSIELEESDFK